MLLKARFTSTPGDKPVLMTKGKPVTLGEVLLEEFMQPVGLTVRHRRPPGI